MSHTKAEFKAIVINKQEKPVGFILKGMTYDGDGNPQWEQGTSMEITMKNEQAFKNLITALNTIKFPQVDVITTKEKK